MAYEFGNDPAKKDNYLRFWKREPMKRPLVEFTSQSWFPLDEFKASKAWPRDSWLTPDMVNPEDYLDEWEDMLREGEVMDDDVFRGVYPHQSIYWCCASLGCQLRILPGNVVPRGFTLEWGEAFDKRFDFEHPWFKKYIEFLAALAKRADGRYPVAHRSAQGPLDIAIILRGHEQAIVDLIEEPDEAGRLLQQLGDDFIAYFKKSWEVLPRFHGGCYDAQYAVWTPGTICRMQEDAIAVVSPTIYEELVLPVDRKIAGAFEYPFMHLHATSLFVLDLLLQNENLKGFEVNHDVGGPAIEELIPHLQKIQQAKLPLIVRGSFTPEEMRKFVDGLEPDGLLVNVMVKDIKETEPLRKILGM